jgi:hypothetical protein
LLKTEDFNVCQQYLLTYIEDLKKRLQECQLELTKQSESWPITHVSLDQIDHGLKDFIDSQRKYLSKRNCKRLVKFKGDIERQKSAQSLLNHSLKQEQVRPHYFGTSMYTRTDIHSLLQTGSIYRLMDLRQQQADIWKHLLMLETRIHCKFLPSSCDRLEHFLVPMSYTSSSTDQKAIELKNQRSKIIHEAKRSWLNNSLFAYEIVLQEHEQQYQNELERFESTQSNPAATVDVSAVHSIKDYLVEQTNQLKRKVYDEVSSFRAILIRNRQRASSSKTTIGVSPEPYVDLMSNPFNQREWNYLSLGKIVSPLIERTCLLSSFIQLYSLGSSFIRLNQSVIRTKAQEEAAIKKEHQGIFDKVQSYLTDRPHQIPRTNPILKQYSVRLLDHLKHSYIAPIPFKDQILACEQAHIAQSIRHKIKQHKLILRVADKGSNFYIGLAENFEQKVQKYFTDTNAFVQLSENPFNDILNRVTQGLKTLASKKLILQWQLREMLPDPKTSELSHVYFNPKTHKVSGSFS